MATAEQQTTLAGNRSTLGGAVSQLHLKKEGRLCSNKMKACIREIFPVVRTHEPISNGTTSTSVMGNEARNCKLLTKGQALERNTKPLSSHKSNERQVKRESKRSVCCASDTSVERPLSSKTSLKPSPTMVSKTKSTKYININARSINNGAWQQHPNRINLVQHSIYSRHMKTSTPINEVLDNSTKMLQNGNNFSKQEMSLRDTDYGKSNSPKEELDYTQGNMAVVKPKTETDQAKDKSVIGITTSIEASLTTVSMNKEFQNRNQPNRHEGNIPDYNERNTAQEDLDIATSEKDFLQQLSDPRLKKSLQNIIKKRRDKVCLSEVVSENSSNCESCYSKQNHKTDCKNIVPNGGKVCLASTTDMKNTPENSTSCKLSQSNYELGNFTHNLIPKDSTLVNHQAEDLEKWSARTRSSRPGSRYSRASTLGFRNHLESSSYVHFERPISVYSGVSSTTSWNKRSRVSSCSSRSNSRKEKGNEIETEETRIILPSSDKGYRPCLTRQNATKLFSVQSSTPLTRAVSKKRKTMSESEVIREFLFMYARIKGNNDCKNDCKPFMHEYEEPVQMISSVPELVVKSAIGQFLKEAFPSKRSTDQILGLQRPSVEQKYEDNQRTKLLKIKTCMKHLASMV